VDDEKVDALWRELRHEQCCRDGAGCVMMAAMGGGLIFYSGGRPWWVGALVSGLLILIVMVCKCAYEDVE
jgi:hypothetical protein